MAAVRAITVRALALLMWLMSFASLFAWGLCAQPLGAFTERLMRAVAGLSGGGEAG